MESELDRYYPRLIRRIQAVLIDSLILPIAVISALYFSTALGVEAGSLKIAVVVGVVFFLEPVLVSVTGGTIGHHINNLKIRRSGADKRLNIILASIRYVVKMILGLPSLAFVLISRRHQAIHDKLSNSVVVHKSLSGVPEHERIPERTRAAEQQGYTRKRRRIVVILAFWFLFLLVVNIINYGLLSNACFLLNQCNETEHKIQVISTSLWMASLIIFAFLGWTGRLYGCRKAVVPQNSLES